MYNKWFLLKRLNFNTLYFSYKFLSLRQAIRVPVFVHRQVVFKNLTGKIKIPQNAKSGDIWIGYGNVGIFDLQNSRTILEIKGTLVFEGTAYIGQGSRISVGEKGKLTIGTKFKITAESCIICMHNITISMNVLISWQVQIMDSDFHVIRDEMHKVLNPDRPVTIGEKVWIGTRCTILKGTDIPSGSILASNSVVSKNLPEACAIYAGQPARLVKENVYWEP